MSNLNIILNKLGKIEEIHETNLGKHEVELALVDDIKKQQDSLTKKFLSEMDKIAKVREEIKTIISNISSLSNEADKTYQQSINLMKKIDELGVAIPNDLNASTASKQGGSTPSISINISGLQSPSVGLDEPIEMVEDVTDVEIKDYHDQS